MMYGIICVRDVIKELIIPLDPVVCVLGALPREIYNEEKKICTTDIVIDS